MYTVNKKQFGKYNHFIEVVSKMYSFLDTKIDYFYYDIENWKRSVTGKKDEYPSVDMIDREIEWVKKHYLPKLELNTIGRDNGI